MTPRAAARRSSEPFVERELTWAQQRVVTEQVARAREALLREFKAWGVSSGSDSQADAVLREVLAARPAAAPVIEHEAVDETDPLEPDAPGSGRLLAPVRPCAAHAHTLVVRPGQRESGRGAGRAAGGGESGG